MGLLDDLGLALRAFGDAVSGTTRPVLRLGVTGLSRAGKTVFITALLQALAGGARLPVFRAMDEGRIVRVTLAEQPDDAVPRFPLEDHLAALQGEGRHWPESTTRISEIRCVIDYESRAGWFQGRAQLTLDIVDYPGEWLLDLPLLDLSYRAWSNQTLALARVPPRAPFATGFLAMLDGIDPGAPAEEATARGLAEGFTAFLRACRDERVALSSLPPGRFLMPGDLAGSPALTFAPLALPAGAAVVPGSLAALMERRFEAYKTHVVRPFFRDHFARLDRQIVLVDALAALNAGPAAVADLESALSDVLRAFRAGRNSLLTALFAPRIDRVLFAATKADHLHHSGHDRLEAIVRRLVARAADRAEGAGAKVDVVALAAIRATREVEIREGGRAFPAIAGVPLRGEAMDGEIFDGLTEAALYPGDLPDDPETLLRADAPRAALRFLRFRPPPPRRRPDGRIEPPGSIRLDRAAEFLLGDRLA